MALLKKLFGGDGPESEEDRIRQARSALDAARTEPPDKAMKSLRKHGRTFYGLFGVGRELHGEYLNAVAAARERGASEATRPPPRIEMLPWTTWDDPMMKDLTATARESDAELLYITGVDAKGPLDAMLEVDVMGQFNDNDRLAMVILGEENMMFRRSFLLAASENVPPEAEELGQDLLDYARRAGLESEFV